MRKRYGRENEANLALLLALYRALKAVRRRETSVITAGGLTFPRFEVLELLYHKGEQTVSELIAGMLSSIGNVSVVLDAMENDGLIRRTKSDRDRRVTLVNLTGRGRRRIERTFPRHMENAAEILGHLSGDEKKTLTKLLIKLEKTVTGGASRKFSEKERGDDNESRRK